MARRKTLPDLIKTKYSLAERLSRLRAELFGDRGGPELARRLGIPVRTWYNYEAGVTVPAEVVLRIIELTAVEPMWLLHGKGPKFRPKPVEDLDLMPLSKRSVGSLLRTALQIIEQSEGNPWAATNRHDVDSAASGEPGTDAEAENDGVVLIEATSSPLEPLTKLSGAKYVAACQAWEEAEQDGRRVLNSGDAMAPLLVDGSSVVYAREEEAPATLDGKLVVAWVDGVPQVRWFEVSGNYALLRSESADPGSSQVLFELEGTSAKPKEAENVRRVLWISRPH